jgi:hypothetical protein
MGSVKWLHAAAASAPAPVGAATDRVKLRNLIWTAIMRAQNEGEADAADELLAILDSMEPAERYTFEIDLRGAKFCA